MEHRMTKKSIYASALAALTLFACNDSSKPAATDDGLPALPRDVHSYAQPEKARVTHVSLDLTPDFAAKRLSVTARLSITLAAGADTVILDVRDLDIRRITDSSGTGLPFTVGAAKEFVGAPLSIALPAGVATIVIDYATSPGA